jgi:peroxiredoxin
MKRKIENYGGMVYIAAQKKGGMFDPLKFLDEHPVSFPFLLDEDRTITKSFGVYHHIGFDAYNIARPATFVIGRDGIIRYLYVGSNQLDRAPVEELLDALKQAAKK